MAAVRRLRVLLLDFCRPMGCMRRVNPRHHAKFLGDGSTHCRDMAIFSFAKDGYPPSWIIKIIKNWES